MNALDESDTGRLAGPATTAGTPHRDARDHNRLAGQCLLGLVALHAAWSEVDAHYSEHVKSYMPEAATDHEKPDPQLLESGHTRYPEVEYARSEARPAGRLFGYLPGYRSTKQIETIDGHQYPIGPVDSRWHEAVEVNLSERNEHGGRQLVGVLRNSQTEEWMVYHATQYDVNGLWDLRGRVNMDINRAACHLTEQQRLAIGFPLNPMVRPTADELVSMFPPKAAAVKAAWAHDREYVAQMKTTDFLASLGDTGRDFQRLQTRENWMRPDWVGDSGQCPTPLEGERWFRNFTRDRNTGHHLIATDVDGNPVEFETDNVRAWTDSDAVGHTEWRPVAMFTPSTTTIEKKTPRARTKSVQVTRYNAYGIAHHETTGEWAVYNTIDTSTSKNWERGPEVYRWDTCVVISSDINKAAAHLTRQQRVALGLPGERPTVHIN